MSNNDFSMMGRARPDASRGQPSGNMLYLIFGGAVLLAALVGALVVYLVMRPAAPVAANGGRAGQGQGAVAAGPQYATAGKFGDWLVRCPANNPTAGKQCLVLLQVNQQNTVVLAWIIGLTDKGMVQGVLRTPTGVNVGKGIDIKVGAITHHANFNNCLPQQCVATSDFDDAFIKEMSSGQKADVLITIADGRTLDIGIQTAGFDKALETIRK